MKLTRRDTLVLAAAASVTAFSGAAMAATTVSPMKLMAPTPVPDYSLGNVDAKVTVIEYGSATCPHCGRFQREVFPAFKEKYIDTNKIHFIFRPFSLNVLDLAVFMLAEAAGPDNYYNLIDTYYQHQDQWVVDNPGDAIEKIALQLGFTKQKYDETLKNQEMADKLQKEADQASKEFGVTGTPTFFINGQQLVGEQTLDEMSAVIDPLLS